MNTKDLYARVTVTFPVSEPDFCAYYNDTVRSLYARYGEQYTTGCQPIDTQTPEDDSPLYDEYYTAALANIIALASGDGSKKNEYIAEGDAAYLAVWRRLSSNKTVKVRSGGGFR